MPTRPAKPDEIDERQLRGWRMLRRFQGVLDRVQAGMAPTARESHGLRRHQAREYLSLFLLAMFNPVLSSMRGLCQASRLQRVQEQCGSRGIGLSRFSEAQQVFDPELIRRALSDLVRESAEQLGAHHGGWPPGALQVIDSTVWKVVPRMQWAQWRFQDVEQRAVRLNLKLRVADEAPVEAKVTMGKTSEVASFRQMWRAGEIYLGDRGYGGDFKMLEEMVAAGCDFLVRVRAETVIHWQSQETLTAEERAAGLTEAGLARLGYKKTKGPWRVVIVERAGGEKVVLIGSACWAKMSALEIAEVYRHRWKIEMFFRWLKCLVPCRHWLAESERGVTFQIYLTLVAALLLAETFGEKPNRRMMELIQFFEMGYASEEELYEGLIRAQREGRRKRELAAEKAAAKKLG